MSKSTGDYWDEPRYNNPDEIDGPADVTLPPTIHHMQARAEVNQLVKAGAIDGDEALGILHEWRDDDDNEVDLEAAVDALEGAGLVDKEIADDIRNEIDN